METVVSEETNEEKSSQVPEIIVLEEETTVTTTKINVLAEYAVPEPSADPDDPSVVMIAPYLSRNKENAQNGSRFEKNETEEPSTATCRSSKSPQPSTSTSDTPSTSKEVSSPTKATPTTSKRTIFTSKDPPSASYVSKNPFFMRPSPLIRRPVIEDVPESSKRAYPMMRPAYLNKLEKTRSPFMRAMFPGIDENGSYLHGSLKDLKDAPEPKKKLAKKPPKDPSEKKPRKKKVPKEGEEGKEGSQRKKKRKPEGENGVKSPRKRKTPTDSPVVDENGAVTTSATTTTVSTAYKSTMTPEEIAKLYTPLKNNPSMSEDLITCNREIRRLKEALDRCVAVMGQQNTVIDECRAKIQEMKSLESNYRSRYNDVVRRLERKILKDKAPTCLKKIQYLEHKRKAPVREELRDLIRSHFNYDEENTNIMIQETFPHLFYCVNEDELPQNKKKKKKDEHHEEEMLLEDGIYEDPALIPLHGYY